MPADSDHVRRDALHAARMEVRIVMHRFQRRLDTEAKAHIEGVLAGASGEVDGTQIGREAAQIALGSYLGDSEPREALDAATDPAGELPPKDVL